MSAEGSSQTARRRWKDQAGSVLKGAGHYDNRDGSFDNPDIYATLSRAERAEKIELTIADKLTGSERREPDETEGQEME